MEKPERKNLLVAFCDLTNYARISRGADDERMFEYLSGVYEIVGEKVERAGGSVVKFMGDAALVTFEESDIDKGAVALGELKAEIDAHNRRAGMDSRMIVKAHFGQVVAGMVGTKTRKSPDILGKVVNAAAMLPSLGYAISPEAHAALKPETRALFEERASPAPVYVGVGSAGE